MYWEGRGKGVSGRWDVLGGERVLEGGGMYWEGRGKGVSGRWDILGGERALVSREGRYYRGERRW